MRIAKCNWDEVLKEFYKDLASSDKILTTEDFVYWLKSHYKPLKNVKTKIQTRSKSKGKKAQSPLTLRKRPKNGYDENSRGQDYTWEYPPRVC